MQLFRSVLRDYRLTIQHYLISLVMVIFWTFILVKFREDITSHAIAMLYLLPVIASAALGGLSTGFTTASLSFLAFNYFFLPPYHTFAVHQWQDIFVLLVFLTISFTISNLMGRAKRNLAEARQREHELRILYDLSLALGRFSSLVDIAQVISDQCQQIFQAECVQISLQPDLIQPKINISAPRNMPSPINKPDKIVPLQSTQHMWGEIHVWRVSKHFEQFEERLLQTFAVQGALALERAALAEALNRAEILEKSDQLKSALLHSVSHELRTPLAGIKAAVTGLLSQEVDWDLNARQELLSVVDEETDHLNRLVGNLLDMSRLEAGALNPDLHWNDLTEILGQALKDTRRSLKNFQLQVETPDNLPLVLVDFLQIERVLVNLLSNSAKFSPPGTQIGIRAKFEPGDGLHLQVTNEGPQVPGADLERIFDKFHRLTNVKGASGTGLGLSICKGIIEAHGGRIWAENLPKGLAFHIWLPPQSVTDPERVIMSDKDASEV